MAGNFQSINLRAIANARRKPPGPKPFDLTTWRPKTPEPKKTPQQWLDDLEALSPLSVLERMVEDYPIYLQTQSKSFVPRPRPRRIIRRLLTLPDKVRLQIYRYCLLQSDPVCITARGVPEPPLLRTCKTIRQEAIPIFYQENQVLLSIPVWDSSLCLRLVQHRARLGVEFRIKIIMGSELATGAPIRPSWPSLMLWLEQVHSQVVDIWGYTPPYSAPSDELIVSGMFTTVHKMLDDPWPLVRKKLREQYCVLVAYDRRWR